jgi:aspartate aminotransferase-like enzyme
MTIFRRESLLDIPAYPASGYARLADRIAALLRTSNDVLLFQAEAIIALEAVATSLAGPEVNALNVVTSPYGRRFGAWLRRAGADVLDVAAVTGLPVTTEAFAAALDARPRTNLVALVHAESASAILNPLAEIAALARRRGAMVVVDAVASVGGHALDVDALGIDIAVIGPQKALGGSAGVSALSVSRRAWAAIERPDAPMNSALSLLDIKRDWLNAGRGALPGMPSSLEFFALEAALDRVEAERLDKLVARHELAARATRSGLRALGVPMWVTDRSASNLVTAACLPDGAELAKVLDHPASIAAGLAPGGGDVVGEVVRLNHTGPRAVREPVLANVLALGQALRALRQPADLDAAATAVAAAYAATGQQPRSGDLGS